MQIKWYQHLHKKAWQIIRFILTYDNIPHKYDTWQLAAAPRASIDDTGAVKKQQQKKLNGFISNPLIALDTEFEILEEVIKIININNNLKLAIKSDRGQHLPIQDLKA